MLAAKPDKVIVRQNKPVCLSGNIHIPECAQAKPTQGVVAAFGRKIHGVKVGDHVLVEWRYGGTNQFSKDGEDYWILSQDQLMAIIE